MRKKNGFTLIELLTVVAIIGLLASIVLVSLDSARKRSRDVRRISDMKQIQIALELYFNENGRYPGTVMSYNESNASCGGWDISKADEDSDGRPFIEPLLDGGFMPTVPVEPNDNFDNCGNYAYYLYGAGGESCSVARGDFYVLGVRNMEGSGNPHPTSPGWSCPGRNWQDEFEWVTGGFTK